jgi:serine/threonine-protein kinase
VEDRYQSLFLVGRGGMGTVEVALEREAEDDPGVERVVALKRLLPEQARDPRHKGMFLREARLAALLRHPNVVHAFAYGELYGELFLAMEYVEGEPLSRVLGRLQETSDGACQALDHGLAAFVLAEVCSGLHAAHELRDAGGQLLNVVHRDVSPHNVMISYDGHIKILDFGVAKFETGGHETRTGEVKGKMAYMSPEQALGERLDRRSDLFSVGALLFECLSGRRMWGQGTDLEVMRRLALEHPPRLEEIVPGVAPALGHLHARLVAREPAARPANAGEVADELRVVASSCHLANASAVRVLMQRLFGSSAAAKRALLNEALARIAAARVEPLRCTMDAATILEWRTTVDPAFAGRQAPSSKSLPSSVWIPSAAALAALVVGVGAATLVAGSGRGRERVAGTELGAMTGAAPASATAVQGPAAPASAQASASAPAAASAPATAPASASASAPAPSRPASERTVFVPPSSRSRAQPVVGRPGPSSRLPDVDPTPF